MYLINLMYFSVENQNIFIPKGRISFSKGSNSFKADLIDDSLISKIAAMSAGKLSFIYNSGDLLRIIHTATPPIVMGFFPVNISDFVIFSAVDLQRS